LIMNIITIERRVLEKNDELAGHNRRMLQARGIFAINIVSSPGAGKTSILERTLEHLGPTLKTAVIEGDVQTDFDARRVARYQVPVVQIITHGGCHLEARLVQDALSSIDLNGIDLLVIENVGNLVCPANYDLGENLKVVVISTTEGDDKPLKYPGMFRTAAVLLINKVDLLPYVNCDLSTLRGNALQINPFLTVFETSCTTGEGIPEWCHWLKEQVHRRK
jgi:hydrogenase nickel incorporation protein HypB